MHEWAEQLGSSSCCNSSHHLLWLWSNYEQNVVLSNLFKAVSYPCSLFGYCFSRTGGNAGTGFGSSAGSAALSPFWGKGGCSPTSKLLGTNSKCQRNWHEQTWEPDEGENAARGAGVKIKFPVLEFFAAAFPMFQEQLCWDLSPHLGFNSWPDSTTHAISSRCYHEA